MINRTLKLIAILDWYDGISLGLVRASWLPQTFLASIVACSQASRERVLALVPVSESQAEQICKTQEWEELLARARQIFAGASGAILLVRLDDDLDQVTGEATVAAHDLHAEAIGAIETAVGSGGKSWFALFRDK